MGFASNSSIAGDVRLSVESNSRIGTIVVVESFSWREELDCSSNSSFGDEANAFRVTALFDNGGFKRRGIDGGTNSVPQVVLILDGVSAAPERCSRRRWVAMGRRLTTAGELTLSSSCDHSSLRLGLSSLGLFPRVPRNGVC